MNIDKNFRFRSNLGSRSTIRSIASSINGINSFSNESSPIKIRSTLIFYSPLMTFSPSLSLWGFKKLRKPTKKLLKLITLDIHIPSCLHNLRYFSGNRFVSLFLKCHRECKNTALIP